MSGERQLSDVLPKFDIQAIRDGGRELQISHAAALSVHQALWGALQNCNISQLDPQLTTLIAQVAQVVAEKFGNIQK